MSSSGNPFQLPDNDEEGVSSADESLFNDIEKERLNLNLIAERLKQMNQVMDSAEYKACPAVYRPSTPFLTLNDSQWEASFLFWRARVKSWKLINGESQVPVFNQEHDESKDKENKETDAHRLSQRQKQITLGKNSEEYKKYKELVPFDKRQNNRRHVDEPITPDPARLCSKRGWDGMVRQWRRLLHVAVANHEAHQQGQDDLALQNNSPKNRK